MITTALTSSCHHKNLVPFWKIPENAFLTLTKNCRKIVQKKQIMPFKTRLNWLFNDISPGADTFFGSPRGTKDNMDF